MSTFPFTFTQYNIGDHSTYEDLARVCDPMETDVVSLNEMHNRRAQRMLDRLLTTVPGLDAVEFNDVEGAMANPFVYVKRTMELRDPRHYMVLRAGTRAGKHNMQKNLVGGVFRFKPIPCRMNLYGVHAIQMQGPKHRENAATQMNRNILSILDSRDAITMVGGDWNAVPKDPSMEPYHRRHWLLAQAKEPVDTFGNRNIDGVVWDDAEFKKAQVRLLSNSVVRTTSDHHAVRAHFSIKVKPW